MKENLRITSNSNGQYLVKDNADNIVQVTYTKEKAVTYIANRIKQQNKKANNE